LFVKAAIPHYIDIVLEGKWGKYLYYSGRARNVCVCVHVHICERGTVLTMQVIQISLLQIW